MSGFIAKLTGVNKVTFRQFIIGKGGGLIQFGFGISIRLSDSHLELLNKKSKQLFSFFIS